MGLFRGLVFFLGISLSASAQGHAAPQDDGAYLDPPYPSLRHPEARGPLWRYLPAKSPTLETILRQTPVKSQGARGTCSIFASTALLEGMLVRAGLFDVSLDLSEEWLEYLVMRERASEGSNSLSNSWALARNGTVEEALMGYIAETWESPGWGLALQRCGKVPAQHAKACLLGHWDPRLLTVAEGEIESPLGAFHSEANLGFLEARRRSVEFRGQYMKDFDMTAGWIASADEAKAILARGIPVTLDLEFFYGAWNHRKAESLGIQRNLDHWAKGIVGYPEYGSLDRSLSPTSPAGHAIVLVGYDDDVVVRTRVQMKDPSGREYWQELEYQGVYYFKNSWGTGGFGVDFEIDGQRFPGYGMITQKYAHQQGSFHQMKYVAPMPEPAPRLEPTPVPSPEPTPAPAPLR